MIKLVKFADYVTEITGMMHQMEHLEPIDVDIPVRRYVELCDAGILKSFLWVDGHIVKGVALIFVSPSLRNSKHINASTDVIYVKAEHRGNSKYFADAIAYRLKRMDVKYWYVSSRDNAPIDAFLTKNNFKKLEQLFIKEL